MANDTIKLYLFMFGNIYEKQNENTYKNQKKLLKEIIWYCVNNSAVHFKFRALNTHIISNYIIRKIT